MYGSLGRACFIKVNFPLFDLSRKHLAIFIKQTKLIVCFILTILKNLPSKKHVGSFYVVMVTKIQIKISRLCIVCRVHKLIKFNGSVILLIFAI